MKKLVFILSVVVLSSCSNEKSEVAGCCKTVVDVHSEITMESGYIGQTEWFATERDCQGNISERFLYRGSTRPQVYIGDVNCD